MVELIFGLRRTASSRPINRYGEERMALQSMVVDRYRTIQSKCR